jgi:hypothetical protein
MFLMMGSMVVLCVIPDFCEETAMGVSSSQSAAVATSAEVSIASIFMMIFLFVSL